IFFFFSSRRRHTRWNCDWSSDVCSSDLHRGPSPTFDRTNSTADPELVYARLASRTDREGSRARVITRLRAASSPTLEKDTMADVTSPGITRDRPSRIVAFTIEGATTVTIRDAACGGMLASRPFVYARPTAVVRFVPRGSPGPARTVTSIVQTEAGVMPVARMLTPFARTVDVPPIAPEVSDTYVRPADQERLSHTVLATSPIFRRTDDRTNVSFEWVVAWDAV